MYRRENLVQKKNQNSLPSVCSNTLGKELKIAKKITRKNITSDVKFGTKRSKSLPSVFTFNTRQRGRPLQFLTRMTEDGRYGSLPSVILCRVFFYFFAERISLPSVFLFLCRAYFFVERGLLGHSAKTVFTERP